MQKLTNDDLTNKPLTDASLTEADLGIIELDTRLDLSVDPFLKGLLNPVAVIDANQSSCTVVVNTAC